MTLDFAADVLARLDLNRTRAAEPLDIAVGPVSVRILCATSLREELAIYFKEVLTHAAQPTVIVHVLEGQALDPAPEWRDWAREPGKTGRKDAVFELKDGRVLFKVRTGVTFLQSSEALVAFGPTGAHPNQVINFINTQILNHCQRDGWQLCHAAAITLGAKSLAIAGLSGGGKSTSILRMMELDGTAFVTNDRLLVRAGETQAEGLGIPKHPRINPGTILHNEKLRPLIDEDRARQYQALPPDDLWALEEKYDAVIPDLFGSGRQKLDVPLTDFWVLNWTHCADKATMIEEVDIAQRPDLLSAIMKSAGPFYQRADGNFPTEADTMDAKAYVQALSQVRVQEVTGRVDFDAIFSFGSELFERS